MTQQKHPSHQCDPVEVSKALHKKFHTHSVGYLILLYFVEVQVLIYIHKNSAGVFFAVWFYDLTKQILSNIYWKRKHLVIRIPRKIWKKNHFKKSNPHQPTDHFTGICLVPETTIFVHGCLVISNRFLCKELVHHPIETTTNKWMFEVPGGCFCCCFASQRNFPKIQPFQGHHRPPPWVHLERPWPQWPHQPTPLVLNLKITGFALSSLETTLKKMEKPEKSPRVNKTWKFLRVDFIHGNGTVRKWWKWWFFPRDLYLKIGASEITFFWGVFGLLFRGELLVLSWEING